MKRDCQSRYNCRHCGELHHSSLHFEATSTTPPETPATTHTNATHTSPKATQRPLPAPSNVSSTLSTGQGSEFNPQEYIPSGTSTTLASSSGGFQVMETSSMICLTNVVSSATGRSVRTYAILDFQSSISFISPELVEELAETGPDTSYYLNTASGLSSRLNGSIISNLTIQGVGEQKTYNLPDLVTCSNIPNCINEVASPANVKSHPAVTSRTPRWQSPSPPNIAPSSSSSMQLWPESARWRLVTC